MRSASVKGRVPPGGHGGDAFLGGAGLAEVAGVQDGQVGTAGDLTGAQLDQADGDLRDRAVPGCLVQGAPMSLSSGTSTAGLGRRDSVMVMGVPF
jgi:hypothetical protein